MSGAINPLPQYAFMAWCSVTAQGLLLRSLLEKCLSEVSETSGDMGTQGYFMLLPRSKLLNFEKLQ